MVWGGGGGGVRDAPDPRGGLRDPLAAGAARLAAAGGQLHLRRAARGAARQPPGGARRGASPCGETSPRGGGAAPGARAGAGGGGTDLELFGGVGGDGAQEPAAAVLDQHLLPGRDLARARPGLPRGSASPRRHLLPAAPRHPPLRRGGARLPGRDPYGWPLPPPPLARRRPPARSPGGVSLRGAERLQQAHTGHLSSSVHTWRETRGVCLGRCGLPIGPSGLPFPETKGSGL